MWSNLLLGEAEVEYGMSETGLVMMDTTVLGIYQTSGTATVIGHLCRCYICIDWISMECYIQQIL